MQLHLPHPPEPRKGPPPTVPIILSPDEEQTLEHLCRAGTTEYRVAMRARAVLLAAAGWPNDAIARHLDRHHTWVRRWRKRFARERVAGLQDRPRSGRPRRLSPLQRAQIVGLLEWGRRRRLSLLEARSADQAALGALRWMREKWRGPKPLRLSLTEAPARRTPKKEKRR